MLLLLSCSQAVCNLFPQKLAVSLQLEKAVPGEVWSRKPCGVDAGAPPSPQSSHPECSRAWTLEACPLLAPLQMQPGALKWGRETIFQLQFLLSNADAFLCILFFLWPLWAWPFRVCVRWPGHLHECHLYPVPHLPPPSAPPASAVHLPHLPQSCSF